MVPMNFSWRVAEVNLYYTIWISNATKYWMTQVSEVVLNELGGSWTFSHLQL